MVVVEPGAGHQVIKARRLLVRLDYFKLREKKIAVLGLDLRDPLVQFTLPSRTDAPPVVVPAPGPLAGSAPQPPPVTPPVAVASPPDGPGTGGIGTAAMNPGANTAAMPDESPPAGPPPDVAIAVSGGQFELLAPAGGGVLARATAVTFSLGPQGGVLSATLAVCYSGTWRESVIALPVRWQGAAIEVELANRVEQQAQLKAIARIGMVPGFPFMAQMVARHCPVDWCTVPAALGQGIFPTGGEFSADFQALVMLARPAMRAALMNIEARDLVIPLADLPGGPALDDLLTGTDGLSKPGQIGVGQIKIQAGMQGGRAEVTNCQIDAGGALMATRLAIGPGGALAGETTILLGTEGADRIRRIEERLPDDRHLGFDGTSTVNFPDGSSARWRSRVVRLAGSVMRPLAEVWPDLGFLGPGETLMVLRAALLPPDPNKVDLIPLGN